MVLAFSMAVVIYGQKENRTDNLEMSPQVREKLEKISNQTDESLSQVVSGQLLFTKCCWQR